MNDENGIVTIDLEPFLSDSSDRGGCEALVHALHNTSAVCIRDPRVSERDNEEYLDLMERYYGQPLEDRDPDQRPKIGFQVGVSPPFSEKPLDLRTMIARMPIEDWPHVPPPDYPGDPKERFFARLGERPETSDFPELNAEPVIPAAFKDEWGEKMNRWGEKMLAAIYTVAEMLALALDIERETFTRLMYQAPHLLAPNGVDLTKWGRIGTIWNGFHRDLNFMTIHGKSRFPGLRIWPRNGHPITVRIPDGCLLLQAAHQLEWMSGGYLLAGFHEVVCLPETITAMERAKSEGRPLIRVSSTVFGHLASDQLLQVHPRFLRERRVWERIAIESLYPMTLVGVQVKAELKQLGLM